MQLDHMTLRGFLATVMPFVGCGPAANEDVAEARDELAGFYSTADVDRQVDPDDTWVSIFEFRADGTGVYHQVSCIGERSDDAEFDWSLDEPAGPATLSFSDDFSALNGQWFPPTDDCSGSGVISRIEFETGIESNLYAGRRCDPQLQQETPDGLQTCDFNLCGGESLRCGGGEDE